jgi:hypothetical protein
MGSRSASIWLYVRVGKRWKYCKPVVSKNNKIKPGYAIVAGIEEQHPEALYYVHYRENGKQKWWKMGKDPNTAVMFAYQMETRFKAQRMGIKLQEDSGEEIPIQMVDSMPGYLAEYKLANRPRSHALMKQTLEEFHALTRKNVIVNISRYDLLAYRQWLIDRRRSHRTASNKMLRVGQFIRSVLKLDRGKGLVTEKDGKYEEKEPQVYTQEELDKFFAKCTPFQHAVFSCYLMTGLRRKELENLTWDCVDLGRAIVRVEAKGDFVPKTWQMRTVEIPSELVEILRVQPKTCKYVFPTPKGTRWLHSWDDCVAIAD